MAIIQTVNFSLFADAFKKAGRDEQFSYRAMRELFEYLEGLSDDIDEPVDLDVIALCCEWVELTEVEILAQYDATPDELQDRTTVIRVFDCGNPTYLVQEF